MSKDRRRAPRIKANLKIRIPRAPRAIEGKTRNVSRHGVFVDSERELPEGQLIQVELTLPEEPLPVPMMAKVIRVEPGDLGAKGGFALDFYALDKGAMEAWDMFVDKLEELDGVALSERGPSRRVSTSSFPALGVKLGLKFSSMDRMVDVYRNGIRKGELWLPKPATSKPKGQRIEIVLMHPNTRGRISLFGEIVGVERTPLGEKGLKVKVFPLSKSADKKLREFISANNREIARKLRYG
ncbi:MAG: PilZ domain-containing protein [Deltaproteobacteria bacterium]|nr:PilZ domain-containing protein [Deltaproteobacteria bacterium]